MKNILFVFFIFQCLIISAATNERHVHIHFKVTNGFGEVTNFIIREIYENGKIDTVQAIEANHILDLPVNHKILLEIICPNHVTRRIAINTTVPDNLEYIPFYELFFDLIETDVVNLQPNRDEILELLLFTHSCFFLRLNAIRLEFEKLKITKKGFSIPHLCVF